MALPHHCSSPNPFGATHRAKNRLPIPWTLLVAVALLVTGCNKADETEASAAEGQQKEGPKEQGEPGKTTETAAVENGSNGAPEEPPSARVTMEIWRPLLDEAGRAELEVDGTLIEFGTVDAHKYTRGGWRTGWGPNELSEDVRYTPVVDASGVLDIPDTQPGPLKKISFGARSLCTDQKLSVRLGTLELEEVELGSEWQNFDLVVPLEAGQVSDVDELTLVFRRSCSSGAAHFDWLWLGASGDQPPPIGPRQDSLTVGEKPKRALMAPSPRSYHFYLDDVPANSHLVADLGAEKAADFVITATVDGKEPIELLRQDVDAGEWQEADVDLSPITGEAVRLTLSTSGHEGGTAGWGEPDLMIPPRELPPPPVGAGSARGTVLIVVDTLRADVFEPYNERRTNPESGDDETNHGDNDGGATGDVTDRVKTPAFDAVVPESTLFANAYVNENWTKPSVATILSGLYPSSHGAKREPDVVSDDILFLPEMLQEAGIATGAFIANGFVSKKFGFGQGWDQYRNYIREGRNSDAENVYADALDWLDQQDGRFFLYIQPIDPHVPYMVPRDYIDPYHPEQYSGPVGGHLGGRDQAAFSGDHETLSPEDYEWIQALYHGEVTYHDEHFGNFVAGLRERGLIDEVLLVFTSDHGEELDDHGKLGHGHTLYEEMTRAPLLMRYPAKMPQGHVVDEFVESVDIAPTILDVMALDPAPHHQAQSLLPVVYGDPVQRPFYAITDFLDRERAIRFGKWKLEHSSGGRTALYNLSEDPKETEDVDDSHPIALRTGRIYLWEGLANNIKYRRLEDQRVDLKFDSVEVDMDEDLKRQLEALGYFGD